MNKKIYLLYTLLAFLSTSLFGKEFQFTFGKDVSQEFDLKSSIDDSHFFDPESKNFTRFFSKEIVVQNKGNAPLHGFNLCINAKNFRHLEGVKRFFNLSDDLVSVFQWWNDHIPETTNSFDRVDNPFYAMAFQGFCQSQANCLANLALSLNLSVRQADIKNSTAMEFSKGDEEWKLLDSEASAVYLNLDNQTVASSDDILMDPLLVLRTKVNGKQALLDPKASWERLSHFDFLSSQDNPALALTDEIQQFSNEFFSIYPSETIIYHHDESPDPNIIQNSSLLGVVEHRISLKERAAHGDFIYTSAYPIFSVYNDSSGSVKLDEGCLLEPGKEQAISQPAQFQLKIASESNGELIIYSYGSKLAFPVLSKGKNVIDLGTAENSTLIQVSYITDDELENESPNEVLVVKSSLVEETCFYLKSLEDGCNKLWWQIASDPQFSCVIPNFNQIQDFEKVQLSALSETFLNPQVPYFFRCKVRTGDIWSEWSPLHQFQVNKPEPPIDIQFNKIAESQYELEWEPSHDPQTTYLVYASNAKDFLPDIYCDKQVNRFNEQLVDWEINQNFLLETAENEITIDDTFAYYRVLAKRNHQLSKPSSLIAIYDDHPQPITALQLTSEGLAERQLLLDELQNSAVYKAVTPLRKSQQVKNSHLDETIWEAVRPYLIPDHHPIKAKLDRIFGASRVTTNQYTIKDAGFKLTKQQGGHIIASKHKKLKGYVIKMFMDYKVTEESWKKWVSRVEGANLIRSTLKKLGLNHKFKVPKKWIYQLPENPPPDANYPHNHFILVVEDMHLVKPKTNRQRFREKATPELLDQIYVVSEMLGLYDSPRSSNLSWTKHGKLAFVDTESFYKWPVQYHPLVEHLSRANRPYWKKLTKHARKNH